jgi:glutathione S-transferase
LPEALKGKGIPGLADSTLYETFFDWRDRIYAEYRNPLTASTTTPSSGSAPTSIEID